MSPTRRASRLFLGLALLGALVRPAGGAETLQRAHEILRSCVVSAERRVPAIPKARRQSDKTDWCWGYAALALAQQAYCRKRPSPCSEKDELSLIDVLVTAQRAGVGLGGILPEGGDLRVVLAAVAKSGRLALDACASFEKLRGREPDPQLAYRDIYSAGENVRRAAAEARSEDLACQSARVLLERFALEGEVDGVARVLLSAPSSEAAATTLLFPARCEAERVALPPLNPRAALLDSRDALEARLAERIAAGVAVGTPLCRGAAADGRCVNQHDTVVVGERTVTCGGSAQHQYLLVDSAHGDWLTQGKEDAPDGVWATADEILERALYLERRGRIDGGTQAESFGLQWLE